MLSGISKKIGLGSLVGCVLLAGCMSARRQGVLLTPAQPIQRPSADTFVAAGADDTVPVDPVPVTPRDPKPTNEIPLVRVPPPPLTGDRPAPMPPAVPVATPTTVPVSGMPASDADQSSSLPAPSTAVPETVTVATLQREAENTFAHLDSYMSRLTRREPGKGKRDEEILLFAARKNPFSIHFKWLAGEGKGREVLYVKDRFENKLHTLLAPGDMPFSPGGRVMSLPLDSVFVKAQSKYPITHAGIGPMIERFSAVVEANAHNDFRKGRMTYLGLRQRPDYDVPLHLVEQGLPPGADLDLPNGGKRLIGYHPRLHLPVLAILYDERDREVDYYRFDRLQLDVHLDDHDFDLANLGKLTRSPAEVAAPRQSER